MMLGAAPPKLRTGTKYVGEKRWLTRGKEIREQDAAEQLRYSLGIKRGATSNEVSKALRDYDLTLADVARWWQVDCKQNLDCFRERTEERIEGKRPVGRTLVVCAASGFSAALLLSWLKSR